MKLTPELIASCPSYLNPLKDRQLDLRGKDSPFSGLCEFVSHLYRRFFLD